MSLSPNTTFSHYRIVSKLGAGGMGAVYLAHDIELDRQVALKVLLPEVANNEDRLRRFVQEAKAASALNHPNILTVYEIGNAENTRFIATELVKGHTLQEHLRGEPLTLRETLDIALQVGAALGAAHGAGIVHRDIKPDNIMLRDDGLVKMLDFGLAKLLPAPAPASASEDVTRKPLTNPGVVMGTPLYMSPEQARGKEIDARSDIWSLGVVLYEMLTGRTPFAAETMNDSIAAILTRDPAPLDSSTPQELQRIVRKSLQKNSDERYQTVKDLQLDLKNLKRELEFSEELERSLIPPSVTSSNVSAGQLNENAIAVQSRAPSTQGTLQNRPLSSAEYIFSEIKSHKAAVLTVLAFVVAVSIGAGYWFTKNRATGTEQFSSIAVLPFENRSGNSDSEYLSDGLAESLIYRLSQLPNLKVSPTSSVLRYKGKDLDVQKIAADLGVNAVMSGRVVQRGDNLTISVELIDAKKNQLLWGEQFERKMSDLLATQREIAAAIADKLQLRFSGNESKGITKQYTSNNEAYQLYLQGRYFWNTRNSENLKKATELFRSATEKDPNFALAYAGLADCYVVSYYYVGERPRELMPLAKTYAAKAIELDPTLAEPHATLGLATWLLDWDMATTEKAFLRAIELNPSYPTAHHWYSRYLRSVGRLDEAWNEIKRAQDFEPLSLIFLNNIAEMHIDRNELDAAADVCRRIIDLNPSFWPGHQTLGITLVKQGRYTEALSEAQKSVESSNRSNAGLAFLGHVYGRLGKKTEAEGIIKELEQRHAKRTADGRDLAIVYSGLNDSQKAFDWLERAFQERSIFMAALNLEPLLEPLKSNPRWTDLKRRVGLPS